MLYQAISWPVYSYSFPESPSLNEPKHDKTNKMSVRQAKTQISLGIRPVWSKSSMCAQSKTKDPKFLHADSEDSDQTGRMPRLIWVFAGRTLILLVLSCRDSNVDGSFRMSITFSSIVSLASSGGVMAVNTKTGWKATTRIPDDFSSVLVVLLAYVRKPETSNEPVHEIMVLFVLRKLVLQTRMRSHPVGLEVWFMVGPFVYFHTAYVRTAKALARLRGWAGSPEPSLVAYVISTIISSGSNMVRLVKSIVPSTRTTFAAIYYCFEK